MTDYQLPLPKEEYMYPGHSACPGCGEPISVRMLLKALGPQTIMNVPAGLLCSYPRRLAYLFSKSSSRGSCF